jgi:antitoxin HigA-1
MISNNLPALHPGLFLAEILHELHISQAQFARSIGVARPVTAELALLFGRALGQSPQYWLNLQVDYDLKRVEATFGERLQAVVALVPA